MCVFCALFMCVFCALKKNQMCVFCALLELVCSGYVYSVHFFFKCVYSVHFSNYLCVKRFTHYSNQLKHPTYRRLHKCQFASITYLGNLGIGIGIAIGAAFRPRH